MNTTSHINERNETGDTEEIMVKTQGNKSLRLNTKALNEDTWLVTLPFQEPLIIKKQNGQWKKTNGIKAGAELIYDIGQA